MNRRSLVRFAPPAAIVAAGVAAYSSSFTGPFVYDDLGSIPNNPTLRHLAPLWSVLQPPGGGATVSGRPILNLTFALNYALGGLDVRGYHAVNLAIHLLAGLALFGIVRRTWAKWRGDAGAAVWVGLAAALLWTVHPLQTGAVTYVVQRAESLMGLCVLLTLYGFVRFAESGRKSWAALSIGVCLLGMGVKEVMVTAPVLVLVFDRTFFAGGFREAWRRRRCYYASLAATWAPLGALLATGAATRGASSGFRSGLPWQAYILTQFPAGCHYLRLAAWPHPLVFDYGPLLVSPWEALPYAMAILALGVVSLAALVRAPPLGFLGFWFFGILAVTSLTPGSSEMIVERRMYLPVAAIVVLAVAASEAWAGARKTALLTAVVAVLFTTMTWRHNLDYQSDLRLWEDTVAQVPDNPRAWYNLGMAWWGRGDVDRAIACFNEAVRRDPPSRMARLGLALAFTRRDRLPEAEAQYRTILRADPDDAAIHRDLGIVLAQENRWDESIAELQAATKLQPSYADAHFRLALALWHVGRAEEAVAERQTALRLDPSLPQ